MLHILHVTSLKEPNIPRQHKNADLEKVPYKFQQRLGGASLPQLSFLGKNYSNCLWEMFLFGTSIKNTKHTLTQTQWRKLHSNNLESVASPGLTIIIHRFLYIAPFSALKQTHCAHVACDSKWATVSIYSCISTIHRSGVLIVLICCCMAGAMWHCCCLSTSSMYTIQPCTSL